MKSIYFFNEADGKNRKLFGGKGAGLIEMTRIGLPVPPGFTITTQVCVKYYDNKKRLPKDLMLEVKRNIGKIERSTGKKLGQVENPLLVSVRSGSSVSMPGMMDTILNLGLNDKTVIGLAETSKNPRFAWDSYRRFIQLFGKVVFGIVDEEFNKIIQEEKNLKKVQHDNELDEQSLRKIASYFKEICSKHVSKPFPQDPYKQLELAIEAVFKSWMGERAVVYREKYKITDDLANGTAVNVVAMVFGNMGDDSATGVVFTRNPLDGAKKIFGEFLVNAQGEDVVAGIRTPKPIGEMKEKFPLAHSQLLKTCVKLERHFKEPQDIEFTIEKGKFYLLQTRSAKMNSLGMIKTSVDMVREKLITKQEAILRLNLGEMDQLLHRTIDIEAAKKVVPLSKGIPASPGAVSGIAVFDVKSAMEMNENGFKVILVREETKPEDVPAFFSSVGILTSRGGKTSHAAVVARGLGKPCIVGCNEIKIDYMTKKFEINSKTITEGDTITIDGTGGKIYIGMIPTVEPKLTDDFSTILVWAGQLKKLGVRANVDTPEAAKVARKWGAEGIGLCRTERMFNLSDRLPVFIEMIMAKNLEERKKALVKLQGLQKEDFKQILRIMEGYPVTIRLLDPPLHEFLPNIEQLLSKIHVLEKSGEEDEIKLEQRLLDRVKELSEFNPMMGHRGVRLGITFPEIYQMQISTVLEAAAEMIREKVKIYPQIMIPQVAMTRELDEIRKIYENTKKEVERSYNIKLEIKFGTMLEVVRGCLVAHDLTSVADFFSFGTNDLTQAVFSFSREDVESKFLPQYLDKHILEENPFQSLDLNGVGYLMQIAISKIKKVNQNLEIGICGEHGGDPRSIKFCQKSGLTYVSTSSHRVPIAILAAAQSTLENKIKK